MYRMRFCSDSDRISHRCAMPFPDVRHGKALGRKHLCSLRSHRLFVMHILQKQAFDDMHTKKHPAIFAGCLLQIALLW